MRTTKRSRQQLERTSRTRRAVFEFMERFGSKHLWTMDGPQDTDLDEILCFAWPHGAVVAFTWWHGSWTILTEPSQSAELDVLEKAMRAQLEAPAPDIEGAERDASIKNLETPLTHFST